MKINIFVGIALLIVGFPLLSAVGCEACGRWYAWRIDTEREVAEAQAKAAAAARAKADREYCVPAARKYFAEHPAMTGVNCRGVIYSRGGAK